MLFIVYIKCDEMFCLCLVIFKLYKFFYMNIFILVVYVLYWYKIKGRKLNFYISFDILKID